MRSRELKKVTLYFENCAYITLNAEAIDFVGYTNPSTQSFSNRQSGKFRLNEINIVSDFTITIRLDNLEDNIDFEDTDVLVRDTKDEMMEEIRNHLLYFNDLSGFQIECEEGKDETYYVIYSNGPGGRNELQVTTEIDTGREKMVQLFVKDGATEK